MLLMIVRFADECDSSSHWLTMNYKHNYMQDEILMRRLLLLKLLIVLRSSDYR